MYKRVESSDQYTVQNIRKMWWSLLALSFTAGAVFASDITFPLSRSFGNDQVTFSEQDDGVSYTIKSQDGSTTTNTIFTNGLNTARSNRQYSVNDCSVDEESCFELFIDDVSILMKRNLRTQLYYLHAQSNSSADGSILGTCVELGDGVQWYGGPEAKYQQWPIQDARWNYTVYHPKEEEAFAIAEPYWVSSEGKFLYVNPATSLFLDQNNLYDRSLCLYAQNISPYRERGYTRLEYWLAIYDNVKTAHQAAVETFLTKPTGIPDERMVSQPIWSTWARYKIYVNDSIVRQYANEILNNGFNHSQLEIDDFWETCYGSLTFSTSEDKFPDIRGLTDYLHDLGFRVNLWVHPFINVDCEEYYAIAQSNGYFVENENGSIFTTWWQGANTSVIDFTNEAAAAWFTSRLTALRESAGIDSFKFDAGEASWSPAPAVLTGTIDQSPGIYTTQFARALAEFGGAIEIRVGWQTQDLPVFVRMLDKDTSWTFQNGLPTLITTLLVMNLAGYGFVLPDMVGGNGYIDGVLVSTQYPSKELFIRWLQANTFMPSIQYSFVPWDYDNETVTICRTYTELHEEYAPTIIEAMNAAVSNGTPVNPPIWWLDPTNSDAFDISDEYLLGEVILVAPVIVEGAVTRDIFLPQGSWVDASYGTYETYEGPTWIYNYPAPLDILPYFVEANYWESLGKSSSVTTLASFSITLVCAFGILAPITKLFV